MWVLPKFFFQKMTKKKKKRKNPLDKNGLIFYRKPLNIIIIRTDVLVSLTINCLINQSFLIEKIKGWIFFRVISNLFLILKIRLYQESRVVPAKIFFFGDIRELLHCPEIYITIFFFLFLFSCSLVVSSNLNWGNKEIFAIN